MLFPPTSFLKDDDIEKEMGVVKEQEQGEVSTESFTDVVD